MARKVKVQLLASDLPVRVTMELFLLKSPKVSNLPYAAIPSMSACLRQQLAGVGTLKSSCKQKCKQSLIFGHFVLQFNDLKCQQVLFLTKLGGKIMPLP